MSIQAMPITSNLLCSAGNLSVAQHEGNYYSSDDISYKNFNEPSSTLTPLYLEYLERNDALTIPSPAL